MIDYQPLYTVLNEGNAEVWAELLPNLLEQAFHLDTNGHTKKWLEMLEQLPKMTSVYCDFNIDTIKIGQRSDLDLQVYQQLFSQLQAFHPWRKGPYEIFGLPIETEWQSDWKWTRLKESITPLTNRLVLDVGCGNGYHCWRMLGADARMVVGIDPLLLNVLQFQVIHQLMGNHYPIYVLPMSLEQVPAETKLFDTVFSMGVLYHRRSPIDHLLDLKACLKAGGELVLETLVIDGKDGEVLMPEGRYAKMRNVWFLPSCETLISWLKRCGFKNCRLIDVSVTTIKEQRTTHWMHFHSLADFLDKDNPNLTCEGLPAPKRAIILANIA